MIHPTPLSPPMLPHPLPRPSPSVPSCSHNPSPPLPVHAVLPNLAHLVLFTTLTPLFLLHTVVPCRPHTVTPTNHPRSWLGFSNFLCLSPCPCTASAILLFPPLGSWVTPFSPVTRNPIRSSSSPQDKSSPVVHFGFHRPSLLLAYLHSPPFSCCPLLFPLHRATSLALNPISVSTSTLN
ncbi:hypothetical protein CPAR01_00504 [Colletotrichum paranaense]|uniref:Uncharacterized protein n=1 Tax=Colletotrichum paranaense TaxID=1914294 RepID=A0ABQ9T428_9PEZI|nr:uncharacterized protein CPAR01_00504 [Colletotrichum paranaense]KAK1546537.1 hypothetical protein CPAR01_00504 [Colletotrichum paranaense]